MTRYVIFDLDDTLVRSRAVRDAFALVAAEHGIARDAVERTLDDLPDRPARDIFAALGAPDPDAASRRFFERLDERNAEVAPEPYPDADATLRAVAALGSTLLLSTGSPADRAREVLDRHGWDVFAAVLGSEDGRRKDAAHYAAIGERTAEPGWTLRSATVGDSPADMRLGAEHGVRVRIGVDRDGDPDALIAAGATHVVTSLAEILPILART